ncbi:hypothetical protein TIFTF001_048172, partial [Ficus carica]
MSRWSVAAMVAAVPLTLTLSNNVWETVNLSHRFSLSAESFFALK